LSFIHVNRGVLDRKSAEAHAWFAMSEEQLVEWEDRVLEGAVAGPDWLTQSVD
jgi:hypothetical protein